MSEDLGYRTPAYDLHDPTWHRSEIVAQEHFKTSRLVVIVKTDTEQYW